MELDLGEIRKNIDAIDDQLLDLFKQRMGLTCQVAQYKAEHNMVVFQSEREKQIIRSVRDRSPEELKSSAEFLFTNIMDISKCRQNNTITPAVEIPHADRIKDKPVVSVQGIAGAYGHAAAQKLFPGGNIGFHASFAEVFEAVEKGDADYGVIPVENSTAGEVTANMDLLEKHSVYINRTVTVPCTHVLAAKHGVNEQDIRILFGHEQAIRQCDEYISSRPGLTVIPYANNAMAAHMVAENRSSELGCICSRECAEMHGLDIVNPAIAADPNNATRFICISKDIEVYDGADTVAVSVSLPHISGSLYRMLTKFAVNELDLTKIQSKPLPLEFRHDSNEVMFYLEFSGNINQPVVLRLLNNFETEYSYFRLHGNFLSV
ncbi:MAG: bifunctional chorismate mutase/prephenate dehydratase [Oscillospiraceae bacterium]